MQKDKGLFVGFMFLVLLAVLIGGYGFGYWMEMKSDEYRVCLDVYHKQITDDPKIVSHCKKMVEDQNKEWAQEEKERTERFLKEFQESN